MQKECRSKWNELLENQKDLRNEKSKIENEIKKK
jgi:hypothetical protein